jgi:hypothetical protein
MGKGKPMGTDQTAAGGRADDLALLKADIEVHEAREKMLLIRARRRRVESRTMLRDELARVEERVVAPLREDLARILLTLEEVPSGRVYSERIKALGLEARLRGLVRDEIDRVLRRLHDHDTNGDTDG